jgi:hypothetical protein
MEGFYSEGQNCFQVWTGEPEIPSCSHCRPISVWGNILNGQTLVKWTDELQQPEVLSEAISSRLVLSSLAVVGGVGPPVTGRLLKRITPLHFVQA